MHILICDDIQNEAESLARLIHDLEPHQPIIFNKGHDALQYFLSGAAVDVCFLDIVMPDLNGVELARALREAGFAGEIVFLSTSHEYGPETYTVKAFSYLLKPPTPDAVRDLLRRIEDERSSRDKDGLMIKTKSVTRFILFRELIYVEVMQHYVYFHLLDGSQVSMYATFGEIAQRLLSDSRFAQCHSSYIVNMNSISAITGKEITLRNGVKLPITKTYSDMKSKYLQWGLRGGKKE